MLKDIVPIITKYVWGWGWQLSSLLVLALHEWHGAINIISALPDCVVPPCPLSTAWRHVAGTATDAPSGGQTSNSLGSPELGRDQSESYEVLQP